MGKEKTESKEKERSERDIEKEKERMKDLKERATEGKEDRHNVKR